MFYFAKAVAETPPPVPSLDIWAYGAENALPYDPGRWCAAQVRSLSNCYAYVMNWRISRRGAWFPQPGQFGLSWGRYLLSLFVVTKSILREAAMADGLIPFERKGCVLPGYYLAALVLRPGFLSGDYHWYRLDRDRISGECVWTHKRGVRAPSARDESGRVIYDLSKADLGHKYPQFGGYFLVPQDGVPVLRERRAATKQPAFGSVLPVRA